MDGRFFIISLVFSLDSNCLARPKDECSMTQRFYLHIFPNGTTRCCLWVKCDPGFEVVFCENPYSADQCRPCIPPFIQPDETDSELGTMCYKMTCPEFSRLDENWNCICDTDMGYYGEYFYDCKYKKCSEGEKLTVWGICVNTNFDLIPVKTTVSEPKPKSNNTQDRNMTNLKPVKISENNEDGKKTDSEDNNSVLSLRNKSIAGVEDKKEKDERQMLAAGEVDFHPHSFLYGFLTFSPFLIFPVILYCAYRIRKKQKNELNCILKTQDVNVTTDREIASNPNKNQTWKPVSPGGLPLRFRFPGHSQFNKLPSIRPTLYAALPHKVEVGKSIGILHVDVIPWGTGFIVGNGHVMTCLHTVISILGIRADTEDGIQQEINQNIHKVKISFHFNLASSRNDTCFGFEQCEMYFDINLDVIILKIDRSCSNYQYLPGPLTRFCDFTPSSQFDFFGHPLGEEKKVDQNCRIKTLNSSMIEEMGCKVAQYLIFKGFNLHDFLDPFEGILNNGYYLFNTLFVAGGSGSPGITFCEMSYDHNDQTYGVGTMLCGEYPNFAPHDIPHEDLKTDLKIQFGTKMSSIFSSMKQKKPTSSRGCFSRLSTTLESIIIHSSTKLLFLFSYL